MPDNEKTPKNKTADSRVTYAPAVSNPVIVTVKTAEAIAEALPVTISKEDREATAEYIVELLKQQKEAFEEASRKREKEHEEVVKALDEEREERKNEHNEAVKWRRISFAVTVILGSISIYLGYLALLVH